MQRVIIPFISLCFASLAGAQQQLSLDDAVNRALEKNLGLQMALFNPVIAEAGVEAAESSFDVVFFGDAIHSYREQSSTGSETVGTEADNRDYSVGASKRLSTGGEVTLSTGLTRSASNARTDLSNLEYNSDFVAELRQPLAQGFGRDVNLANIRAARSALTEEELRLEATALDVIAETEDRYWLLSYAYARLELLQSALKVAETLAEETRQRESAGLTTRLDVLESEAALAARREEILLARQEIQERTDLLLGFLGELDETYSATLDELQVATLPTQHPLPPPFSEVWPVVAARDLDTAAQQEVIRQLEYERLVAQNATKPRVDAVVGVAALGRDPQRRSTAVESALDRDGHRWNIGVSVEWPWKDRLDNARLRQVKARVRQNEILLVDLKQQLLQQTRSAYRDYQVSLERLEVTRTGVNSAERAFEQTRARYDRGISSFRQLLESQRDLDASRIAQLQAHLSVVRARIALDRLQGALFERHGLTFNPRYPNLD